MVLPLGLEHTTRKLQTEVIEIKRQHLKLSVNKTYKHERCHSHCCPAQGLATMREHCPKPGIYWKLLC